MAKKAKSSKAKRGPIVLLILDGWGVAPKSSGNAISLAKTPMMDYLYLHYPNTTLNASGVAVGLPKGQVGNSETGHMNIGAGRVVKQDILDINDQIENGKFYNNTVLKEAIETFKSRKNANIHIIGLLTGVHSSHTYPDHLYGLLELLKREKINEGIYLHLFADGRDSGPYSGVQLMEKLMREFRNGETISTLVGRFYAMDRAQNWERTKVTYDLITNGTAEYISDNPIKAFSGNYNRGFSDEYLMPTVINNPDKKPKFVKDGDVVIFYNCRSDRARQLAKPFVQKDFEKQGGFKRKIRLKNIHVVTFTEFAKHIDRAHNAFPSVILENTLPCALADNGLSQAYLAEEEKYAHMTYFLNGGSDEPRCDEKRYRFPSQAVKSFAEYPDMSTSKIVDKMVTLIEKDKFDFYAANFANADMLGHTGDLKATLKGIEVIDSAIKRLYTAVKKKGGYLFITADHGNAESLLDSNGEFETRHNRNPVPFFCVHKSLKGKHMQFKRGGKLANIVPTMFDIAGIEKPKEMSSKSLIKKKK